MSELQDLLSQLEEQWRRHGLLIAGRLRPGLSEDEVRSTLNVLDVSPSREYVEWFGWHDGAIAESMMTPIMRIETLDRCVQQYTTHVIPGGVDEDTNAGWFPIATIISGSVVVTDCTGASPDLAVTTVVTREGERHTPDYYLPSLTIPVRWWVELFADDSWTAYEGAPEGILTHLDEATRSLFPWTARQQGFVL